jgi:hypothetical protein
MSDTAKGILKFAAITAAVYFTGGAAAGALGWSSMGWSTAAMIGGLVQTAIGARGLKSQIDDLNDGLTTKQSQITVNRTGTEVTVPIIYGKAKVGMGVVDVRLPTDQNILALVGTIAIAPESGSGIDEVTKVYFNEDLAIDAPIFGTNSAGNNPTPFDSDKIQSPWNGGVITGTFGSTYWLQYFMHDGDNAQVVDFELKRLFTSEWGSKAEGVGVAYVVLWLYYNDGIFTNGVPSVTMEVKGNKVLDCQSISTTAAYSENPADCIYDYMTSKRYGMGIPAAQIDCAQTALQADPIATTSGSAVITVAHSSALDIITGSRVLLSGAAATGGITAARLNVEMTVASVPSTSSFTADLGGANATSTVAAGGGASVIFDASSFGKAAAYCDESVTITLSSGTETLADRFTCNGFLLGDDGPLSNLDRLLSSCCGRLVMEGGKYKIFIRKAQAAETFELDRTNIVGEWQFVRTGVNETPNTLVATHIDSLFNYQPRQTTWPEAGVANDYLAADNDYVVESRLELPFTENAYMAEMITSQQFLERRADMGCALVAQREALKLSVGDVVNVTHSTPSWTDQPMWVEAVALRRDGLVQLALKEYDAAAYTVPTMTVKESMVASGLPVRYPSTDSPTVTVNSMTLVGEEDTGSTFTCSIDLNFSAGMGSYTVGHNPSSGTYEYTVTPFTGTNNYETLTESDGSTNYIFQSDPADAASDITITPYPDADKGGVAGPPMTATFNVAAWSE